MSHPEARYFSVGHVGRDQVQDYARRKGMTVDEAERVTVFSRGAEVIFRCTAAEAIGLPEAFRMAGVRHEDIDLFQPYDDYPMVVLIQMEDYGFCRKGEGARFVAERDLHFDGDFPISADGGQLSGGQPGGGRTPTRRQRHQSGLSPASRRPASR